MKYVNEKLKEFEQYIRNKKVAIIGLGVSNLPLLDYFSDKGADVTVFDKRNMEQIDRNVMDLITARCIHFSFGEHYLINLVGFDLIFRSPSCRPDIPELLAEEARGAIITSEIDMVVELCPGKVIGITGSDGKTTTTSLIYEIIKEKGYDCYLGGNIGIPLFTKIKDMKPETVVVLELSSFQLMDMQASPEISVITNISPNHLDIHKSYEEYIEAKKNIFKNQSEDGIVVLNYDNEITRNIASEVDGKVVFFSRKTRLDNGVIYDKAVIKSCEDGIRRHVMNIDDAVSLRGMHNYENICAAIAATQTLVEPEIQARAINKFKGVEHRIEFVRTINGAKWYNDSIGTSPTRTIAGLNAFDEKIVLIAGGYDKHLDYTPIAKPIVQNVSNLILVGATADKIQNAVEEELNKEYNSKVELPIYRCETLEECVNKAKEVSKDGEVVLFSPASASFDMYKNFMERGNKFKDLVNSL